LIIQIPCFNEAEALPATLAAIPRAVAGFDSVEILVIDDGSVDETAAVARACGADEVVRLNGHQGLARAFMAGLDAAIERGADVIVNTDADNQYNADDIPALVRPILDRDADIVIGARPIETIEHFSPIKRRLQRLGSRVVRSLSNTDILDAPSGFRAMTRDAALRLNVFNSYTYTLETIIQAGRSNLRIVNVPVRINGPTRPSRLMGSTLEYLRISLLTLLSVYLIYRPTRIFNTLGVLFCVPAVVLAVRYVAFAMNDQGTGHVQSVIASGVLGVCGVFMFCIGIAAHLLAINRRLLEQVRYLERKRQAGRLAGGRSTMPVVEVLAAEVELEESI
jgi:glycosyltransferase involved in cell wall biosynthesis